MMNLIHKRTASHYGDELSNERKHLLNKGNKDFSPNITPQTSIFKNDNVNIGMISDKTISEEASHKETSTNQLIQVKDKEEKESTTITSTRNLDSNASQEKSGESPFNSKPIGKN